MQDDLQNLRKITLRQKWKTQLLKWKFGNQFSSNGAVRILGKLPVFKLPGNSKITLGSKVVLNSDDDNSNTALTYRCTLACGLTGTIEIGDNSMLNGVSVTAYEKVSIGKNCQIASCTIISDTDFHPVNPVTRQKEVLGHPFDRNEVIKKPVVIGDNVWIGWGAIILKGVTIGNNCIVAAGSVVLSSVPENSLVAGNPAIVKKTFNF